MKPILTNRILAHITQQITNGRPLWGLLWANEYLDCSDPIHKALVLRAKMNGTENSALFKQIAQGACKSDLTHLELNQLNQERGLELRARKPVIIPRRAYGRATPLRAVGNY